MLINESDMLGRAERGTTKLLTPRVKIPYGSAEPYHDTAGVYITHPQGAYHEFRKEFYITNAQRSISRRFVSSDKLNFPRASRLQKV